VWRERVLAAVQASAEPGQFETVGFVVVLFDLVDGNFSAARALLDRLPHPGMLDQHPLAQHRGFIALTVAQLWMQAPGDCIATAEEALEQSRRFGFQVRDHLFATHAAWEACLRGDLKTCNKWLRKAALCADQLFPERGTSYHAVAARHALLSGRPDEARRHAELAVALSEKQNWRLYEVTARLTLTEVRLELGELDEAEVELGRLDVVLARSAAHSLDAPAAFLRADLHFALGNEKRALSTLAMALSVSRDQGGRRIGLLPARVARLCGRALKAGLDPDLVRDLIRYSDVTPPDPDDEAWP
jgi:tetratricopeptide (TPR) repeat protein